MTDTMKALAKTAPGVGLELIDAPIPEAGPEDVLIRVHRTAVCGTDIHIWNWDEWSQKNVPTPMITGHEFAGEIVAVGKDVDRPLKIGQRQDARHRRQPPGRLRRVRGGAGLQRHRTAGRRAL
jgi:threonine 3-dehydrogenase